MLGIPSPLGFCLLWCHQHGIAKMMQQSTVFTNAWLTTCAACSMKAYLSRFDRKTKALFLETWGNKSISTSGLNQILLALCPEVGEDKAEMNFYVAAVGCKGDWPWVRKAFHLATGYKSNRICHLCPSQVSRDIITNFYMFPLKWSYIFWAGGHTSWDWKRLTIIYCESWGFP